MKIILWSQLELILVLFRCDTLVPGLCPGTPCLPGSALRSQAEPGNEKSPRNKNGARRREKNHPNIANFHQPSMTLRYAHLSPDHKRAAITTLEQRFPAQKSREFSQQGGVSDSAVAMKIVNIR